MFNRRLALVFLIALSVALIGCPKKKPQTSEDLSTRPVAAPLPTASATDVTGGARPATTGDEQAIDPLKDSDLANVNAAARSQGLLGDVYFDYDRFELKQDARDRLAKNADFLRSRPEFMVTIEGHCDDRGTNDYNLALGDRRAGAARDYIVALGVPASRVRIISYGEERPACSDANESCWSQNRRAHFVITGRSNLG